MTDPIVEFLDLDFSEGAVEWMDKNGRIKDIDKLDTYLKETCGDPVFYLLQTFNDYLENQIEEENSKRVKVDPNLPF